MSQRFDPSGRPIAAPAPPTRPTQGRYGPLTPQMRAQGWTYNESGQLLDARGTPIDPSGRPTSTATRTDPSAGDRNPNGSLQNPVAGGAVGMPPQAARPPVSPVAGAASPNQQGGAQSVAPGTTAPRGPGGPAPVVAPGGPAAGAAPPAGANPKLPRSYDNLGHASDGSQSIGDDNPWKIGAIEGGTFDPDTMAKWLTKAKAGDKAAQWVLQQVDYHPGESGEDWAARRKLDRYVPDEASAYQHDPGYDDHFQYTEGQGYGNQANATASYGWWDDDSITPRTGPREAAGATPPQLQKVAGPPPAASAAPKTPTLPTDDGYIDVTDEAQGAGPAADSGGRAIPDPAKKKVEDWRDDPYFQRR